MAELEPPSDTSMLGVLSATVQDLQALIDETRGVVGEQDTSSVLVPLTSGGAPEVLKRQLASRRADLVQRQQEIKEKAQQLDSLVKSKLAELNEVLLPMQQQMEMLQETIWTVNLYLGTEEQIKMLADGEPAPADSPICVRQMVLSMDQECAVAAESGGIDAVDIDSFDEWLVADLVLVHRQCGQIFYLGIRVSGHRPPHPHFCIPG